LGGFGVELGNKDPRDKLPNGKVWDWVDQWQWRHNRLVANVQQNCTTPLTTTIGFTKHCYKIPVEWPQNTLMAKAEAASPSN